MDEVMAGPTAQASYEGPLAEERALLASAKKISLFCSGAASQKFGNDLGRAAGGHGRAGRYPQ